jgi:regulator of extracellular matrix RemA (YlzA/DUF370 family)
MGIQQAIQTNDHNIESETAKTCMSIIWVKNGANKLDKMRLIQSLKKMTGVADASFTRETPAIVMVDYRTDQISAAQLVEGISGLGVFARRVGC